MGSMLQSSLPNMPALGKVRLPELASRPKLFTRVLLAPSPWDIGPDELLFFNSLMTSVHPLPKGVRMRDTRRMLNNMDRAAMSLSANWHCLPRVGCQNTVSYDMLYGLTCASVTHAENPICMQMEVLSHLYSTRGLPQPSFFYNAELGKFITSDRKYTIPMMSHVAKATTVKDGHILPDDDLRDRMGEENFHAVAQQRNHVLRKELSLAVNLRTMSAMMGKILPQDKPVYQYLFLLKESSLCQQLRAHRPDLFFAALLAGKTDPAQFYHTFVHLEKLWGGPMVKPSPMKVGDTCVSLCPEDHVFKTATVVGEAEPGWVTLKHGLTDLVSCLPQCAVRSGVPESIFHGKQPYKPRFTPIYKLPSGCPGIELGSALNRNQEIVAKLEHYQRHCRCSQGHALHLCTVNNLSGTTLRYIADLMAGADCLGQKDFTRFGFRFAALLKGNVAGKGLGPNATRLAERAHLTGHDGENNHIPVPPGQHYSNAKVAHEQRLIEFLDAALFNRFLTMVDINHVVSFFISGDYKFSDGAVAMRVNHCFSRFAMRPRVKPLELTPETCYVADLEGIKMMKDARLGTASLIGYYAIEQVEEVFAGVRVEEIEIHRSG